MLEAIDQARVKHEFHLWAYVLMPEHVHMLIWPTRHEYSISQILASLKVPVSRRALAHVRAKAPEFLSQMEDCEPNGTIQFRFWQRGGGFDRNITEPTTIWAEIDYIHANPPRRGLCERAIEWPWSSAAEYEFPGTGLLKIDRESLPIDERG